jgi:hypothetical protein
MVIPGRAKHILNFFLGRQLIKTPDGCNAM